MSPLAEEKIEGIKSEIVTLKKAIQESIEEGAKTNIRLSQETEQLRG